MPLGLEEKVHISIKRSKEWSHRQNETKRRSLRPSTLPAAWTRTPRNIRHPTCSAASAASELMPSASMSEHPFPCPGNTGQRIENRLQNDVTWKEMKTINKMQILRGIRLIHDPYSSPCCFNEGHTIRCPWAGEAQFTNEEVVPRTVTRLSSH